MTKYLVKIISICAFVVLLPVIIAGVAVSAIGSQSYNLSAYLSFEGGANQYVKAVEMRAGEKGKDKTTLNAAENKISLDYIYDTDVSVSIVDHEGYDFIGWFDGDNAKQEFDESQKLTAEHDYSFALTSDTQVTARLKTIEYKVTFVDEEEQYTQTLKYGQPLTPLTNTTDKYFAGWKLAESENVFETAIFPETMNREEIVLVADWKNAMTIEYYTYDDGEPSKEPFAKQTLSEDDFNNFQFIIPSEYKETVLRGYEFAKWLGENELVITPEEIISQKFEIGKIVKIYMSRTPIIYNMTVGVFDNSVADKTTPMTFNVRDGFSSFTLTRDYYTLQDGIVYNGETYTKTTSEKPDYANAAGKLLSDKLIDDDIREDIRVTAVWECNYDQVNIVYTFKYQDKPTFIYARDEEGQEHILNKMEDANGILYSANFRGKNSIKVEDSIVDIILGKYTEFYIKDGEQEIKVNLAKILLNYTDTGTRQPLGNTIADLFKAAETEGKPIAGGLTIQFEFAKQA